MAEHDDFVIGDLADTEGEEDARDAEAESPAEEIFAPTDEPEEITAEEASHTDIPAEPTEVEDSHLTATVCDVCLELNLTHPTSVITCARCGQPFCFHFASTIDAQYCVNCLSDISVSKSVVTKTYEHKNDQGDIVFYRRRAREIQISGLDWLFAQRKINELSDLELDLSIEYHRNILSLMCTEQEQRRTAKMHRYAGVKIHLTPSVTDVNHTTTTTVKKTRTVSKTKAQEQIAALLKNMAAKGMTMDKIAAMLKKA
jgi:hypothetical protein